METWKACLGFEGHYEVSDRGRVRSIKRDPPTILKPANLRGYRQLIFWIDGEQRSRLVHRLVAIAFIGAPPTPEHTVNHKDYDKANNVPSNLEWMTQPDNVRYSKDVIPRPRGERNHSKLNESQVTAIRAQYATGSITGRALAKIYGVSDVTIWNITSRRKWAHVP